MRDVHLNSVNISLDTLRPERFRLITRRGGFERVWENLNLLIAEGFCQVKINCVVLDGVNQDELIDFARLTEDLPIHVRFIEFMPFAQNGWSEAKLYSRAKIISALRGHYGHRLERAVYDGGTEDTADLYRITDGVGFIGIIASITQQFCSSCNRLRLTADGKVKNCLFGVDELDLGLHETSTDKELLHVIRKSVKNKKPKHGGMHQLHASQHLNRPMVKIGG
eukprot:GHVQ01004427.1.p1 GENE.GHVQ01004427.1~~GHVQ01004427.1.p1  ORF type:complete len:254 (+),score=35.21 GHVQ01004427.1:94-762(+)